MTFTQPVDQVIQPPASWLRESQSRRLRYFIPDWDDLVDPHYDFQTDALTEGGSDWSNQVYAHQLYPTPNYDGLLVSRIVAENTKRKQARINELGVHRYLRAPAEFPILGDCGAFGYVKEKTPPYSTADVLDYYTRLGFDYGVSVDHLIVSAADDDARYRYDLTLANAEEFWREHQKRRLPWTPIGAVQGWDAASYREAARRTVAIGYDYVALGGLVRMTTPAILETVQAVREVIPPSVRLHLFGVARLPALADYVKLGVQSVDSASYLRKAWLGSDYNYATLDDWYSAVRIPLSSRTFRAKRLVQAGVITLPALQKLEAECLDGVRRHAAGRRAAPASLLDRLVEYDTLIAGQRQNTRQRIQRTLDDRPWQRCGCGVCRRWGVEVAIFRGNNRNRRRGFHNTHIFFELLRKETATPDS